MRTSLLAAILAIVGLAAPAGAQTGFMPYLGYNLEDEDFLIGVGARFGLPLEAPVAIVAQPSVEYQFAGESVDIIQADANVIIEFTGSPSLAPYAGLGIGFTIFDSEFTDSETEIGLNALGGVVFNPVGFGRPFVQGRFSTRGEAPDAISIQGGVILGF